MLRAVIRVVFGPLMVAALFAQGAAAQAQSAPAGADYFPLEVGNKWTYALTQGGASRGSVDVDVASSSSAHGQTYFALENYFGTGATSNVRETGIASVVESDGRASETLWYLMNARVGRRWQFVSASAPGCTNHELARVMSRTDAVDVPAGHFTGCVRLAFTGSCRDAGVAEEVFAPGVGLIRRTEDSIAGPIVWELVSAAIAGRTIPTFPIEVSIAISQQGFVFGGPQPVNPPPAPTLRVRLTVRCEVAAETFSFPTTQRYDIRVRDAKGAELWLWSRDTQQHFQKTAGSATAAPGRPLVFEQTIPAVQGGVGGRWGVERYQVEIILWDEQAAQGSEENMARTFYTVIEAP